VAELAKVWKDLRPHDQSLGDFGPYVPYSGPASWYLNYLSSIDRAHGPPLIPVNPIVNEVHAAVAKHYVHTARVLAARGGCPLVEI